MSRLAFDSIRASLQSNSHLSWSGGQYSLYRFLLGIYLFVHFAYLLPWATELFSNKGMLSIAEQSPLFNLFPSLLILADHPLMVVVLIVSGAVASIFLALGYRDKFAAFWCWYVLACLFTRNPLIANPALPYVGWMLLAHLFVPSKPFGSLAALGRASPAGDWFMPKQIVVAASIVLALSYSYSGYTKLLSPSWVDGNTLSYVLENPLARDWFLRDLFLMMPSSVLQAVTIFILVVELLYAPLALVPRLRPWLWSSMLVVQFGFLFLLNFPDLTIAMLLFHLLTFNPQWLQIKQTKNRIYYDGNCGLCHRVIRFVLSEDRLQQFRFAPLESNHFRISVPRTIRNKLPETFVVVTEEKLLLTESDAVIYIGKQLGGLWRLMALLLACFPQVCRNSIYRLIGQNRHRLFARPMQVCPILPKELEQRFDLANN